jgi:hypothetical protein
MLPSFTTRRPTVGRPRGRRVPRAHCQRPSGLRREIFRRSLLASLSVRQRSGVAASAHAASGMRVMRTARRSRVTFYRLPATVLRGAVGR